ncbi:TetR/AcrR family transcriptional regulator [Lacrimispora saccharolytica]|uniref:Transcriptional regulator, TetR family n=1 Tax=Lacrimispora saccharolytica (strain ATCC 35040 / DSM 2544 / NRCC 2533 / WM1) TaxID=610130 RepID=D9QZW9_LACSW|nr:TetR-like C-terminal domain-containing protein [Lacrimispora saccharolytica]ADL04420.1 transcriptional regulator, TetR family [[Clostridium] saccharolyticum WM1]QRV21316.1 TetR/AcrR family transcriptional regulator [Lacrimispora saccharolytica]
MEMQKQDRRIRKTQKLLKESLLELMVKKDFKNISVKDITELADLNRGTFYLHYADTYSLLQEMESEVLSDFQDMVSNCRYAFKKDSLLPVVIPIIQYIEENKKICKILFENSSSNDFVNRFHMLVLKNGTAIIKEQYPDAKEVTMNYFLEFITYGLTGVLKQWVDTDMQQPKEEVAEFVDKVVMGTAKKLLAV